MTSPIHSRPARRPDSQSNDRALAGQPQDGGANRSGKSVAAPPAAMRSAMQSSSGTFPPHQQEWQRSTAGTGPDESQPVLQRSADRAEPETTRPELRAVVPATRASLE